MLALRNRVGCKCCTTTPVATMNVTVFGCSAIALPGATVTFTRAGQPTQSGVADATGAVTISFPATGSWTIAVSPPTLPERFSTTYTIITGTSSTSNPAITVVAGTNPSRTITLNPATGYGCLQGCVYPAQAFVLTEPQGTVTLQWSTSWGQFIGCAVRTIQAGAATIDCAGSAGTGGTTAVLYTISGVKGSLLTYMFLRGTNAVFQVRPLRGVTCTQALAGISNLGEATGASGCTAAGTTSPFSGSATMANPGPTCPPAYAATWHLTGGEGIIYPGAGNPLTFTASE